MKIIRWLLSHTFLILVIVAVIYGYMFWGNLAGEDTPAGKALAYLSSEYAEVGEFVAAIKAKQKKLSQQDSSASELSEAHEPPPENDVYAAVEPAGFGADTGTQTQIAETKAVEKNDFTAPADENRSADYAVVESISKNRSENRNDYRSDYRSVEQQQVSISYSHNDTRVKQNAAGIIETVAEPVGDVLTTNLQGKSMLGNVQSAADGAIQDAFVSAEIEQQLDNVDSHGRLKPDSQQDDAIRASWITARKSFYQRKYALSEQKYQDVIDNTDDNYDAYGELGNVYFNQGKKEQAATAYFEAAAILFRKGQVNRARSLIGLLRHLDKSKANELQKLIDSSLS